MDTITLIKSPNTKKKLRVIFPNSKYVDFGASGYTDFILSGGDEKKKKAYIQRHQKKEDWTNNGKGTAGFWSRFLLWNANNMQDSINDVERRLNMKIVIK